MKRAPKAAPAPVVDHDERKRAVNLLRDQILDAQKRRVIVPCPGCGYAAALVHRPNRCGCGCEIGLDLRDGEVACAHCAFVFTRLKTRLRAVCWQRRVFLGALSVDSVLVFIAHHEARKGETNEAV